jgi:integrase
MQKAKAEGRRENVRVKVPVWRVPASRMKMDTLWLQPLSPLAVAILERARELRTSDAPDALIFPGFSRNGALSENALLSLLARGGFYGRQTTHGMRASFASWAHPIGFDGLAVELCLAHRPGGVLGTYNRSEYILERLEILTAWADELTALGLVLP